MNPVKNLFSAQAKEYKQFRPTYPTALYQRIYQEVQFKEHAWDCGTGNGQVAIELAKIFKKVDATDISESQLVLAEHQRNIIYTVTRAEQTNFAPDTFDLIIVAQAIHWFDFELFYQEVARVIKSGGLLAIWGYGLIQFNEATINTIIKHFYKEITGPYWDTERHYIDEAYQTIPFPFPKIQIKERFFIQRDFTLSELAGYLNTWSSIHKYKQVNHLNPVNELITSLQPYWQENQSQTATFPLFLRLGRIE